MDAVITYVNGDDPLWKKDYEEFAGEPMMVKRFRDWGTLPFLFRGIETYMPFIDRVFLVVSRDSQVPEWLDRSKVNIVYHKDFIPEEYLPTFNASMIEMFLHRIPGLGEKYVYMNDDVFPVRPVKESDLFPGGKPAKQMSLELSRVGDFRRLCKDSCNLARKAAGLPLRPWYYRPQHSVTPFLKSACEEAFAACEKEIMASLSRVRKLGNFNQYFFSDYMFFKHIAVSRRISHQHFSLAITTADDIVNYLQKPRRNFVCINDVDMPKMRYMFTRERMKDGFAYLFNSKCGYEL
jgi:hypothetical protein